MKTKKGAGSAFLQNKRLTEIFRVSYRHMADGSNLRHICQTFSLPENLVGWRPPKQCVREVNEFENEASSAPPIGCKVMVSNKIKD